MKKALSMLLTLGICLSLSACGGSSEQPDEQSTGDTEQDTRQVLTFNQHNSKESLNGQISDMVATYVNEHSKNIRIEVYYNGELGGVQESLEGVAMGTIHMGSTSCAQLASMYTPLEVFSMPYLIKSADDLPKLVDLENNELLADMTEEFNSTTGITIFGYKYNPDARQLTCNFPVYSPADLAGTKLRSQTNQVYTVTVEGMGGVPVPIDWTETIAALTTGTVEGQENPYSTIWSYQLWDCQKYAMETSHIYDVSGWYINTDTWNSLSAEDQQILKDSIVYMQEESNKILDENLAQYKQEMIDNGMTIITAEDGLDIDAFKSSVDAEKKAAYPQYEEYFNYLDEYLGY